MSSEGVRGSQVRSIKSRRLKSPSSFPTYLSSGRKVTHSDDASGGPKLSQNSSSRASVDRNERSRLDDLSREELRVHEQLQSLDCSQDGPTSHSSQNSSKRIPKRPFAFASQKTKCDVKPEQRCKHGSLTKGQNVSDTTKSPSNRKVFETRMDRKPDRKNVKSVSVPKGGSSPKREIKCEAPAEKLPSTHNSPSVGKFSSPPVSNEVEDLPTANGCEKGSKKEVLASKSQSDTKTEHTVKGEAPGTDGERQTPPHPCGTVADGNESSDDSSLSDYDDIQSKGGWRAQVGSAILRRSTRSSKSVERYDPSEKSAVGTYGTKDVFGDIISKAKSSALTASAKAVKLLVKECKRVEELEAENDMLRENMETTTNMVGEDEHGFKSLADNEKRQQDQDKVALMKYSLPLPIFSNPVSIPVNIARDKCGHNGSSTDSWCTILSNFMDFHGKGDLAASMLASVMTEELDSGGMKCCPQMVSQLLNLCVFDDTLHTVGGRGHDDILEVILKLVRLNVSSVLQENGADFPSLISVLQTYGVSVDPNISQITQGFGTGDCRPGSLDAVSARSQVERTPTDTKQLSVGLRNLKRAYRVAAAQLESGWVWKRAIGLRTRSERQGVLQTVILCTKILFSSFGSRLKREVGLVVKAAIMRCPEDEWPSLRWEISKAVMMLTSRLQLHVELVTYLFPFNCERTLNCSLDIAYLSLLQWGRGPSLEPVARDVSNCSASACAKEFGLESISYCLEDILEILEGFPELGSDTDVVWGCGMARLLKQILTMPVVVARRKPGHLGILNRTIGKLRHCTHRLRYDVAVQEMRMALDALIRVLRFMGSADKQSRSELYPNAREEFKQTKL